MSEHPELGAYVLGLLDAAEVRAVDQHLAGCPDCRRELAELTELEAALGEVPPEAFLDGPPEDGDLLLQRTLRQVRAETGETGGTAAAGRLRPRLLLAAAAAVALAVSLGAGVLIGRSGGDHYAEPPSTTSSPVPGQKNATASDPSTDVTMAATVVPAAGWVKVHVDVKGLPVGAECELRVTDKAGHSLVAGSWLVSEKGAREGAHIDGGALVPIDQVASVDVVTFEGRRMVSVPL